MIGSEIFPVSQPTILSWLSQATTIQEIIRITLSSAGHSNPPGILWTPQPISMTSSALIWGWRTSLALTQIG